jgi:uncharacterized repeat protein (TIGR01451 family)
MSTEGKLLRTRRGRVRGLWIGVAALSVAAASILSAPGAWAAGNPQVPQPPRVVYTEGFENNTAAAPVLLTNYTGAGGTMYTADPPWLSSCNGWILQFGTPESALSTNTCPDTISGGQADDNGWALVREMAWALGSNAGQSSTSAQSNHAVTAYTDNKTGPSAAAVQFATSTPTAIQLVAATRFITFSVDAAEVNCATNSKAGHSAAKFEFYLTSPSAAPVPTFNTPIDPCTNARAKTIKANAVPLPKGAPSGFTPQPISVGTFPADEAVLFTGSQMGIEMLNAAGTGLGNDAAFDNIRVLDATPALDKSFVPAAAEVGQTSQLTYTITNTTDLAAKNGWSFTDTLPAGLVVASPSSGSTTCTNTTINAPAAGGTISVTGSIAAGVSYCTVSVNVTSATTGTFTNGPANVVPSGIDPPGPATVVFGANADMQITKTAGPSPAVPGNDVTFTLHVTNAGPDPAQDVVVSDPVPAPLSFVSATSPCTLVGGTVTCSLGTMNNGDTRDLTIVEQLPSSATDGVVNVATVSSSTPDPNPNNNSATASVPLGPQADLQIEKRASASLVLAGGQVMYTLAVGNNGPSDATDVTVSDPLPAGLTLVSAQPSQGSCDTTMGVVCNLGSIVNGAGAQVLVTAKVAQDASGTVTNAATVAGGQPDPVPDNNSSSATIDVIPIPIIPLPVPPHVIPLPANLVNQHVLDVAIVKHVNHSTAYPGQKLTYKLDVTNRGVLPAFNVRVTDTADQPVKQISAHPSQGTCALTRPLRCTLGPMKSGAHATITIVAEPTSTGTGTVKNTSTVTSAGHDDDLSNNVSSATVKVKPVLRLRKTASPNTVSPGQTVTYHLAVSNPTTVTIHHVTVCDSVPTSLVFVSASPRARPSAGRWCWSIAKLGPGKSKTLTLLANAAPGPGGKLTNTATATALGLKTVRAKASVTELAAPPVPPALQS